MPNIRFCYLDCLQNSEGNIRWWKEIEVEIRSRTIPTLRREWMNNWNGQFDEIDQNELAWRMRACESAGVPVYEVFQDSGPDGENVYELRLTADLTKGN